MGNFDSEQFKILTTFKVLFEERSAVAAAERLNTTQSAVSKQLKKLRAWFGDELFVRTSNGMEATEKALALIDRVESILIQLSELNTSQHFDPSKLTGYAVIETTDEVAQHLAPKLLEKIAQHSSNLGLKFVPLTSGYSFKEMETGKVDVAISVNWHAPDQLLQKRLSQDQFKVLMHRDNPLANNLNLSTYSEANHILVAPLSYERTQIDQQLAEHGLKRNIKLYLSSFGEMSPELLNTGLIVTLPAKIAQAFESNHELLVKPLPFKVEHFNYYLFWHQRYQNNQRNAWLREQIFDVYQPSPY